MNLFFTSLIAQDYYPPKRDNISEATFNKYSTLLKSQYNSTKRHTHMNIALCYAYLGESEEVVFNQIDKAINTIQSISCTIVGMNASSSKNGKTVIYETINKNRWEKICTFCDSVNQVQRQARENADANNSSLNRDLIAQLQQLLANDSKMRSQPSEAHNSEAYKKYWKEQNRLDSINQKAIRKIIEKHGYPGKSLVGQTNADIAFLIIQHGSLEMQEEYLPIILEAQKKDEINLNLVYLLVDRIHTKKYGKQIFGTQKIWDDQLQQMVNVSFYSEKEKIKMKKKYDLK